jgi:leader peptidase (prepilin peptidase) / N-methyltransferase
LSVLPVAALALLGALAGSVLPPTSSRRRPLGELITAVAFGAVGAARGVHTELVLLLPFVALLVAVAAIDLDHRIIPNRLVLPAALFGLAANALVRPHELPGLALSGGLAFLLLLLAALAHPAGMGMGDVKLAGVMGLYLGSSVAAALLAAFLAGSLAGVVKVAREGPAARKSAIPFGPFLALGGLVAVLVGPELVHAYREHLLA